MPSNNIEKRFKQIRSYTILIVVIITTFFTISAFININTIQNHIQECEFHKHNSVMLENSATSDIGNDVYIKEQTATIIRNHFVFWFLGIGLTFLFSHLIKKEVKSLFRSEEKYETLIDASPFPIILHDKGILIFANDAAVKLLELDNVNDLLGKEIINFVHSESIELVKERMAKLLSGEENEVEVVIEKFVTAKGNNIYVEVKAKQVHYNGLLATMIIFQNITERKIWIDRLRASEANLRSLLNNNRISFVLFDTRRQLVYYNSKSVELFEKLNKHGLKKEDAIKDYFKADASDEFLSSFNKALTGENCTYEKDYVTYENNRIILLNDLHPVRTDRGEITGVVLASSDITSQKISELHLKESRERLKTIYTNTNIGIVLTDNKGIIEYSNPAFSRILKYSREELTGKSISELTHPDDYQNEVERIERLREGESDTVILEKRFLTKEKNEVWARSNITCSRNEDNSIKHLTGIVEDITDRKLTEIKLKQINLMKDILSNSIMNSPLGMILWEVEHNNTKIIDWNIASEKMFGWKKNEVINKNFFDLITKIPGFTSEPVQGVLEKNENYPSCYLTETKTKDGRRINVNLHNTAMYDTDSHVIRIMSLVQDVTEQKRIEKELIKAKDEAEKADKLKSEFLAQMSHEIRTPINAMLSFTSLIKEDVREYNIPDMDQSFDIIHSAGNRIIRTTDLLINMAEIQTNTHDFNPHVVDIKDDILFNLYPAFKPHAKQKGIDLLFNYYADKTKVYVDEYMLRKVFDNLIDNGIKFTNKGSVEVTVENPSDEKLKIVVKDTGIGISEDYMKNLFRPFSQEESGYTRKFEGNGLGLALVKHYCDMNKAEIKIESEKGKGSSFIIELNLA